MSDRFDLLADRLAGRLGDQLLERVAEMLDERDAQPPPLMDAAAAAKFLGIDRSAVYAMTKDGRLPVVKLGDSDRPRLRFDPRALTEHLAAKQSERAPSNGHRSRRRQAARDTDGLLPIKGAS